MEDEFQQFAHQFRGLKCWNVSAGVIGSIFYLDFGRRVPLPASRKASARGGDITYRGEFVLHVHFAEWRLDDIVNNLVLATSADDNSASGPIMQALPRLTGRTVTLIEFRLPGYDCGITFDNELRLNIFATAAAQSGFNYAFWNERVSYLVGPHSVITVG